MSTTSWHASGLRIDQDPQSSPEPVVIATGIVSETLREQPRLLQPCLKAEVCLFLFAWHREHAWFLESYFDIQPIWKVRWGRTMSLLGKLPHLLESDRSGGSGCAHGMLENCFEKKVCQVLAWYEGANMDSSRGSAVTNQDCRQHPIKQNERVRPEPPMTDWYTYTKKANGTPLD